MSVPFTCILAPTITFTTVDGKMMCVGQDHPNYAEIKKTIRELQAALKDGNEIISTAIHMKLEEISHIPTLIEKSGQGRVVVVDGEVFFEGEAINNAITRRILWGLSEGYDMSAYILFLDNAMENPSKQAVDEMYLFMEANNMGIFDDGYIIGYKKVNANLRDIYTNRFDNSPGQVLSMRRNAVDDRRDVVCSTGFHFCSMSYLPEYGNGPGDRIVIVKVHPRDIVSVPEDYKNAKVRCCKYEVISEYTGPDRDDLLGTKAVWSISDFEEPGVFDEDEDEDDREYTLDEFEEEIQRIQDDFETAIRELEGRQTYKVGDPLIVKIVSSDGSVTFDSGIVTEVLSSKSFKDEEDNTYTEDEDGEYVSECFGTLFIITTSDDLEYVVYAERQKAEIAEREASKPINNLEEAFEAALSDLYPNLSATTKKSILTVLENVGDLSPSDVIDKFIAEQRKDETPEQVGARIFAEEEAKPPVRNEWGGTGPDAVIRASKRIMEHFSDTQGDLVGLSKIVPNPWHDPTRTSDSNTTDSGMFVPKDANLVWQWVGELAADMERARRVSDVVWFDEDAFIDQWVRAKIASRPLKSGN